MHISVSCYSLDLLYKQYRGVVYLASYTRRVLYLLILAAVFAGTLSSSNFIVNKGDRLSESEQKISDSLVSDSLISGSLVSDSLVSDPLISGSLISGPSSPGPALSGSGMLNFDSSGSEPVERESGRTTEEEAEMERETEESFIAYVHLFSGTDAEVLASCARVEEWDEDSGLAAVRVKPESFEELSSLKGVYSVQPAISPVIRRVNRGEKGIFSFPSRDFWKPDNITGSGIKIGIISDGVENLSKIVASGALPRDIYILSPGKGNEGTIMLEIVHEISPDAELYFHSAGGNKLEFNRAVDALIAEGCRIICDDVGWPDEPFFEDGIVAAHIKEIIESQDILYISAAGNDAGRHYQGMFFDNGSGWHDFSSGTSTSRNICMDVPPGEKVTVVLQWNDPWNCSENDYDLYLYDCNRDELAASEKVQSGTGTPLEYIQYTNRENTVKKASVSIKQHSGQNRVLEVYIYPSSSVKIHPDNLVEEDSVFGHPAVPGVICVGAIDSESPENRDIASYSSRGPVSIYYPEYELRNKTDLSGPGSVKVSGPNGTVNLFAGTSASAPSVAGIGALIWSIYPEKNGSEIREILCSSAEDLGAPGYDTVFGHGSVTYSTAYLLNPSTGNNLSPEKSGVLSAEAISPAETRGIFTLKLSIPLEQMLSGKIS